MASNRGRPPHPGLLTPAETKVLALIREGLHNPEIALRLGVSVNTIRFHVSNLLAKSGATDRHALRNWYPQPDARPKRLPGFGLAFLKPFGIATGCAAAVAVAVAVVIVAAGRGDEPTTTETDAAERAFPGAVVGTLTRQSGALMVREPGGASFSLASEMSFAPLVGSQVFIVGEVQGATLSPAAGSRIGPYSRCAGVLAEAAGRISVGGSCRGMELTGVPIERVLALRSEKVTVTILPCTQSDGGRIVNPPIDAFGEERTHTCPSSPVGVPLAHR